MTRIGSALDSVFALSRREAALLLAHSLSTTREWVLAHPEAELTAEQTGRFNVLIAQAQGGTPLPYLLGQWEFCGLDFRVTPEVLIPRPETELLIETALRKIPSPNAQALKIVDAGTGSGIIGVTLAVKLPQAEIWATDISSAALEVAKSNAMTHNVADRIRFIHGDLLEGVGEVNLICANLPYIPTAELASLPIAKHEPTLALDGGPDGLRVIERLLALAADHLLPNGVLLAEMAAIQGQAASALAHNYFPSARVEVHKDLAGLDRVVEVEL